MLPDNWRIQIENLTGGTIDANLIDVIFRGRYLNSSGKLVYGSETSDFQSQTTTISDGAFDSSDTQDNGNETDPFVEGDIFIQADLSGNTATPDGDLVFRLQRATSNSPDWPNDGEGEIICVINFPNAKSNQDRVVEIP